MFCKKLLTLLLFNFALAGCTNEEMFHSDDVKEAQITDRTRAGDLLQSLPAASEKTIVSVYDFQDLTGQFKNNEKYSDFSSAVTKGGHSILTKSLLDAGSKSWFTVTERGSLKDLLQERQIIKTMRSDYAPKDAKLPELPPLLYSGLLVEGGIVGYDSNVITGGAGALYLGIGANTRYARDIVTVYLRAVNVQTGEVMLSVNSSKTIFSTAVDSNVLKYITFDRLLQAEAGFTLNEPVQLATRQAIETAVYSMIMEGAIEGLWEFKNPAAGKRAIAEYIARRDGDKGNGMPANPNANVFKDAMDAPAMPVAAPEPQAMPVPMAMPMENPVATAAATQPVVSQPLPAPTPQAEVVVVPAPRPQVVVTPQPQAAPVAAAAQPQVIVPAPRQAPQVAPGLRNREFEPQLAPENGPISQNMAPAPGTATGWGYDGSGAQAASSVVPVAYQRSETVSVRQRPKENVAPVYY